LKITVSSDDDDHNFLKTRNITARSTFMTADEDDERTVKTSP